MTLAVEAQFDAVMHQPFLMQPAGNAGALQQFDRVLLQHAGADAAEDVIGAAAFEDDGFDAVVFEQATKQQAGGTGTDDDDLRAYFVPLPRPAASVVSVHGA
jgi:hypothetical protein